MAKNVMIDLETGGLRPGCKIFSIGACVFRINNGVTDKFYIEIQRNTQCGLVEDPVTMEWWSKQSVEARQVYEGSQENKTPLVFALNQFSDWLASLKDSIHPWANPARFDFSVLYAAYDLFEILLPWDWRNERCYKTLKAFYGEFVKPPAQQGVHHNALDDSIYQAEYAILMLRKHKEFTMGV